MAAPHSSGSGSGRRWSGGNLPRTHPSRRGPLPRAQKKGTPRRSDLPRVVEVAPETPLATGWLTTGKRDVRLLRPPIVVHGKPDTESLIVAKDVLADLQRQVECVNASAIVCRMALADQAADHDTEVAVVLRRWVIDELTGVIDRITRLSNPIAISNAANRRVSKKVAFRERLAHELVVQVSRDALRDISFRLSLVKGSLLVSCGALIRQNADHDAEVASQLKVTNYVLERQVARFNAIADARLRKGQVIASVGP
jgi:hypothetical protein